MKQFYETYQGDQKLSPLARELPWSHNRNPSPAMVAQYQLQLPDKNLIAAKLHELLALHQGLGDE